MPTDVSWTRLGLLLAEGEEDGLASPTSAPLAQKDTLSHRMERPPAGGRLHLGEGLALV